MNNNIKTQTLPATTSTMSEPNLNNRSRLAGSLQLKKSKPSTLRLVLSIAFAFVITHQNASAQTDTTAPQLVSIDFTPKSVDVSSASQIVTVTAHLTDNIAGASSAGADFFSPSGLQLAGVSLQLISGTVYNGIYQGTMTIAREAEHGTWKMSGRSCTT